MSKEEVDAWLHQKGYEQFAGKGLEGPALKNATLETLGYVFEDKMGIVNLLGARDEYLKTGRGSTGPAPEFQLPDSGHRLVKSFGCNWRYQDPENVINTLKTSIPEAYENWQTRGGGQAE